MAATEWEAEVRGFTLATYEAAALTVRNAILTARGLSSNSTTDDQWNAATDAADAIVGLLNDVAGPLTVTMRGSDSGDGHAQISVTVTRGP